MQTRARPKLLASLSALSLLSGCGTLTAGTDSGCKSFKAITWSKKDTPQTKREVVAHNKAYDAICK